MDTESQPATREHVMSLMARKESLEAEIKALYEVLASQNVGMDSALVDEEGYPRADVDVYQVRHARHDIRCKENDLKSLMKEIEAGLHSLHSQAKETVMEVEKSKTETAVLPFARVMVVVNGSPADTAGVKQGDLVCRFGSVTKDNFKQLKNISDVAEASRGRNVDVIVLRDNTTVRLRLQPGPWHGAGLIGFKIRPVVEEENVDR